METKKTTSGYYLPINEKMFYFSLFPFSVSLSLICLSAEAFREGRIVAGLVDVGLVLLNTSSAALSYATAEHTYHHKPLNSPAPKLLAEKTIDSLVQE